MCFITGRNEVVAKVIFLHLFVILFTGGVSTRENPLDQGEPPPSRHPPRPDRPSRADTTPPGPGRPPGADTPPDQADPPGADTPRTR